MSGRRTIIRNQISGEITHQGSIAGSVRQAAVRPRRKAKGRIKSSTVAIYASIFVLLVVLIAIGYRSPQQASGVANTATAPVATKEASNAPVVVDDVVASNIAANVATTTNLSVAPSVSSLAISTKIESQMQTSDASSISKPQIIEVSAASRNITTYTVKDGDTIDSLAKKFGITKQTIKWANDMVSDALTVGTKLQIPPTDGVIYTVQSGDTIKKLAEKYKSDATLITTYNDLDLTGIKTGLKIVIPDGQLPSGERPGYVEPVVSTFIAGYSAGFGGDTWRIKVGTPMYSGNGYAPGYCTAYAYDRRVELGLKVGGNWGNANTWAYFAQQQGYEVSNTPTKGAIMQNGGGLGHVAIVEELLPNGDINISEMNASVSGGGWNIVSGRTISAATKGQYLYIK